MQNGFIMQNTVASLNKEIASHISVNKDILSQSSIDQSSTNKQSCAGCKEKSDEIKTLKSRLSTTESTIKDYEKQKISANTVVCC